MLSKPNVNDLMEKSGNRYETVIALAKRARQIERRRNQIGDSSIKDAVDIASEEIIEQKSFVKRNGEFICPNENDEVDMNTVISETVDGILKDLALDINSEDDYLGEDGNKIKKDSSVAKIVDEKKTKLKKATKGATASNE